MKEQFKPLEFLSAGKKQRTEEEIKQLILKLDRYDPEPKYDWATMTQDNEEGEWIRLEDVLNIFGAKKRIKKTVK